MKFISCRENQNTLTVDLAEGKVNIRYQGLNHYEKPVDFFCIRSNIQSLLTTADMIEDFSNRLTDGRNLSLHLEANNGSLFFSAIDANPTCLGRPLKINGGALLTQEDAKTLADLIRSFVEQIGS